MTTRQTTPEKDAAIRERAVRFRKARRRRRFFGALFIGFLLAVVGAVALTLGRHAILRRALKPAIEEALGVEFVEGRFYATLGGVVSIDDPVWRAPGIPGEAGAVFSAARLSAEVDFGAILGGAGSGAVSNVEALRPVIRLSQDIDTGDLNIDPIVRHTTSGVASGAGATLELPQLRIVDGALEFGEHTGGTYAPLARLRVEGVLEPPRSGTPEYDLTLTEIIDDARRPMLLTGALDFEGSTASLTLRDFDLSTFDPAAAPSRVRDLWSRLAIEGMAPRTEFHYSPESGVEAEFELAGVNLTTPAPIAVNPNDDGDASPETLRMEGVDGFIRFNRDGLLADLTGRVEDVDLRVELATDGFEVTGDFPFDSTVTIEPFFFREGARAALFAPPEAQEIVGLFLGPQALVRGAVHIRREEGAAGNVGDVLVEGLVTFEDGQMAYGAFPYPIRDISGQVAFDSAGVELRDMRGFGPTGAVVTADGEVIGYGDDAGVDIRIHAEQTPIDGVLAEAMPDAWRPILDGLIDHDAHQRMLDDGLVQTEAERDEIAARISRLSNTLRTDESLRTSQRMELERDIEALGRRLRIPVFEPGGVGSADIRIARPRGEMRDFDYDIVVTVPKASLLPRRFAYPLIADPLRVVIREEALIESDGLRGLAGGSGSGRIVVSLADEDLDPAVDVAIEDLPIDPLLRDVLPSAPVALGEGLVTTPGRLLADLGLSGVVDATLRLAPDAPAGAGLVASVRFENLVARPSPDAPALLLDLRGEATLDGEKIRIGPVTGAVPPPRSGAGPRSDPAQVRLLIDGDLAEDAPTVEVALTLDGLSLESPIERLVDVFSPDAADALRDLRAERDPSGQVDASIVIASETGGGTVSEVRLENGRWLSFNTIGGRVTIQRASGSAVIDIDDLVLRLDRFGGSLLFDAQPAGRARIDGYLGLTNGAPVDLTVGLDEARFESTFVRSLAARQIDAGLAEALDAQRVRGEFSAEATVLRDAQGSVAVEGWLEPQREIGFGAGEAYVRIDRSDGRITFGPEGGRVDGLRLEAQDWSLDADGAWTAGDDFGLDLIASVEATGWPRALVALLPEDAAGALEAIDFRIDGPWRVNDARITASAPGADLGASSGSVSARASVTDAAFFAGVDVDRAIGDATIALEWSPEADRPGVEIDLYLETLQAMGVALADARAQLRGGASGPLLTVEGFSADFAGGRIAGGLSVRAGEADGAGAYDADLRLAGVDLGALVASVGSGAGSPTGPTPERGAVSGQMFLTGRLDDPESRIGRGVLLAEGGELLDLPFLLGVIELTNLQAPRGEQLDYAVVEFLMQRSNIFIERMLAESSSIRVEGEGRLSLERGEIDLTFTSRGKRRVPLLSNLVDTVRNELIAARVTGTLLEPRFRAQPLPSAGRVLEGALGASRPEAGMVGDSRRGDSRRDRRTPTVPLRR